MLHRLCLLSMILVTSPAWGSSITEITLGIVLDGSGYPGGWVAPQVDGASGLNVAAAGDSTYSLLDVGSGIPDGNYLLIVGSQYGDFWFGPSGTLSVVIQYSDSSQREESFSYGGAAVLSGTTPFTSLDVVGGDPTLTLAPTGLTTLHLDQNSGFADGSTDTTLYDTVFLVGTGTAAATPEPGTWWELGTSLGLLIGYSRRKLHQRRERGSRNLLAS